MKQASDYAEALEAPLIFCTNGSGKYQTRFLPNGKELILNGNELDELVREKEALLFLKQNSNEIETIPQQVRVSREDLIKVFKNLNDTLRGEGIRAGIERFSEFANILFLKLLSENDEKSWWNQIKNQTNDDIIGYINKYLIDQIQQKYGGNVFTPVSIKNPQTLRSIIDSLDPLVLSTIDTDIKGDAFEYFLEKTTSTENDLGEYFTPRHIVKTIVSLVDPKPKETIYDPFCGTGGFLTSAFQYIKENKITDNQEDLDILRNSTLYGRELTTTARIAKMNMILHGDGHSGIEQIDSLANPNYYDPQTKELKKFDIVITNMPFSQTITRKIVVDGKQKTTNEVTGKYNNGLAKNSGDGVCVLHCLNSLKKGGRMALVVPEGFLFRKDLAQVREHLLKSAKLQSVISLPQGAFLPYTGVKTDILYFTNAHEANDQKEYWYFDVKNVGFTLDNNRRKIKENDLTKIDNSDIRKAEKEKFKDNLIEIGFEPIEIEKIKKNDFSFIGKYYLGDSRSASQYPIVELRELERQNRIEFLRGQGLTKKQLIENGSFKCIHYGEIYTAYKPIINNVISKTNFEGKIKSQSGDVLVPATTTADAMGIAVARSVNENGVIIGGDINIIRTSNDFILADYLALLISTPPLKIQLSKYAKGTNILHLSNNDLRNLKIPIPPILIQKEIIKKIQKQENERLELEKKVKEIDEKINGEIEGIWS